MNDKARTSSEPWIIVSQVKSNRVVYFTDDPDYQPAMDGDWYYCSSFVGDLPDGMSLRNCWRWRFNGGVFEDARQAPRQSTQVALLENNRKALLRILRDKVNAIREPFLASCKLGEQVRQIKLSQAHMFLAAAEGPGEANFAQLEAVALARHISMLAAARLIIAKAEETEKVMLESERFREQLTQAIGQSHSEAQLLECRTWLLDQVYPELSRQFSFSLENTEPPNLDAPLKSTHRLHEITRLKAQLREAINQQRAPLHSAYIQNDEVRRHKARLAHALLANGGIAPDGMDFTVLDAYARGRALDLPAAARLIVNSMAVTAQLLAQTEAIKDGMLARIEAIRCLRDIRVLDEEVSTLGSRQ
jgi:hypothetical protein